MNGHNGLNGPRGRPGSPGAAGKRGARGPRGFTGRTGKRGWVGKTGKQGPRGRPGARGASGATGRRGATGAQGPRGARGPQGVRGRVGKTGGVGRRGATGRRGPKGRTGRRGKRGYIGSRGPRGPRGPHGPRGRIGTRGLRGTRGRKGRMGRRGPRGGAGPRGRRGPRGLRGPQGARGAPAFPPGMVQGVVRNAINGRRIGGALVDLRLGRGGRRVFRRVRANSRGFYRFRVPARTYTLEAKKRGFTISKETLKVWPRRRRRHHIFLSPPLRRGAVRIVLSWGPRPKDLDIHLKTPTGCLVKYNKRKCNRYTKLDADVRRGFGPETVTINRPRNGTYLLKVHKYSRGVLRRSGARVFVYGLGRVREFRIGLHGRLTSRNRFWNVFRLDFRRGRGTLRLCRRGVC